MADRNEKKYKERIASMTDTDIQAQILTLEAERQDTEREIERVLAEIAGQTGISDIKPKKGKYRPF